MMTRKGFGSAPVTLCLPASMLGSSLCGCRNEPRGPAVQISGVRINPPRTPIPRGSGTCRRGRRW